MLCLQRDPAKVSFTARLFFVLFCVLLLLLVLFLFFFFFIGYLCDAAATSAALSPVVSSDAYR